MSSILTKLHWKKDLVTALNKSDSGTGTDAKLSGNPAATLAKTETGKWN